MIIWNPALSAADCQSTRHFIHKFSSLLPFLFHPKSLNSMLTSYLRTSTIIFVLAGQRVATMLIPFKSLLCPRVDHEEHHDAAIPRTLTRILYV